MTRVVAVDVGGTHARFAIAEILPGERPRMGPMHRYRAREHQDLAHAWRHFAEEAGETLPPDAAIAAAAALGEDVLTFVNSPWTINTRTLKQDLGVDRVTLLNDFGAVAHAVAVLRPDELVHIHGPDGPLPSAGVITIMGPGTGLGVAMMLRRGSDCHVLETEGGHFTFAPIDAEEFAVAEQLRAEFGRVSLERVVSGPGLVNVARALAALEGDDPPIADAAQLWTQALDGADPRATHALDLLLMALGTAAGDYALGHGSNAVVLTGGLVKRMLDRLGDGHFIDRFVAKGRNRSRMAGIMVKASTYDEAGLLGAAVAFQREHCR